MSVYFENKTVSEEEKKKQEDQENLKKGAEVVGFFVSPVLLMFLWNWIMPGLFGLATINYGKALGLFIMSRIIFPRPTEK